MKKLFINLLAIVCLFTFIGCGGGGSDSPVPAPKYQVTHTLHQYSERCCWLHYEGEGYDNEDIITTCGTDTQSQVDPMTLDRQYHTLWVKTWNQNLDTYAIHVVIKLRDTIDLYEPDYELEPDQVLFEDVFEVEKQTSEFGDYYFPVLLDLTEDMVGKELVYEAWLINEDDFDSESFVFDWSIRGDCNCK